MFRSRSPVATNDKEPPLKKKKKASISSLPDDLLLSCFSRISKLHYPTLSLVSKTFRPLLASPELYETRSLLGRTESCLYVFLRFPHQPNFRWFTLCERPHTMKTKKTKKKQLSGNLLVPIRIHDSLQALWSNMVAIGSSIYSMGGFIGKEPSSNVSVLDCRSHMWHQAPNMQVARKYLATNVIDGKIYVIGGRLEVDYNSSSWIEVFDPKTRIWSSVSSSGKEICGRENIDTSIEIDGKVCMYGGGKVVAYNPKDGTCEPMEQDMCKGWVCYSHCVIDNVVFYYHDKMFKWFDTKARLWKDLKGLEGTIITRKIVKGSSVKLVDYGGKISVLWDKHMPSSRCENKEIWCAVIAIEKSRDEIWGTVEWVDVVLTVPVSCTVVRLLSVTL